jgi:Peptidase S24-like
MAKSLILKKLINELDISMSAFEREIGISASTIVKSIERDADISPLISKKITMKYPSVNPEWLETGEGRMFLADEKITLSRRKEVIPLGKHAPLRLTADQYAEAFGDWAGLPMYNNPITASFIETYKDEKTFTPQYYLHDPRFRDCDFGAIITGDSMHSEIRHGDFIACKEITDMRFIVFGDIYYVVATNGLETCKYLNVDPDDRNNYLLVPRNELISPSPIPKDMILRMYKVRGIVRGY